MFPDATLSWKPFPSEIDGIKTPFVLDMGSWKNILHLIVVGGSAEFRGYGIEIDSEIYAGFDERIYSMADHGDGTSMYNGTIFIKEASNSALVKAYTKADYLEKIPRHFLFVGTNYCYECLSFSEPKIRTFATEDEAYQWRPLQE